MSGIIVLEGADSAGKTTLAKHICDRYKFKYLHGTHTPDAFKHHLELIYEAIAASEGRGCVLDRHWISEQVYGPIMRGKPFYNFSARCFDRLFMKYAAIYVMCIPSDRQKQYDRFIKDKRQGKQEYPDENKIKSIIEEYNWFTKGLTPGERAADPTYVQQFKENGGFINRPDVRIYDMDVRSPETFATELVGSILPTRRARQFQLALKAANANITGYVPTASYVLLGEQLASNAPGPWPFFWNDRLCGATWLNAALHRLNVDETALIFMNAKSTTPPSLEKLVEFHPRLKVIAMGGVAQEYCERAGVPYRSLPHPQWARRFNFHDRDKYDQQLKEALV